MNNWSGVYLVVQLLSTAVLADERQLLLVGKGANSCTNYLFELHMSRINDEQETVRDYHHWASGYISAVSMVTPRGEELLRIHRNDNAYIYIRSYCRRHQESTFVEAVAGYVLDLAGRL
ncbi:hypothetical protein [Amphritea sp. HPY]|uniref:hypothetical protein n=1 Tax=Amphritea sp. HPY TaxID=3421652 RepID=UPI003D7C9D7A